MHHFAQITLWRNLVAALINISPIAQGSSEQVRDTCWQMYKSHISHMKLGILIFQGFGTRCGLGKLGLACTNCI